MDISNHYFKKYNVENTQRYSSRTIQDILKSRRKTIKKNETQWIKLPLQQKIKRLNDYAELLMKKYNLTKNEYNHLKYYLKSSIYNNRLVKNKDVELNKDGTIHKIPKLMIKKSNKTNEHRFTLKEN